MGFRNLQEWIDAAKRVGELRHIPGAHWEKEIGLLTELAYRDTARPSLLFSDIPDHPGSAGIVTNALGSPRRLALTLGLDTEGNRRELGDRIMARWREVLDADELPEPRVVTDAPVLENVLRDDEVDLSFIPSPLWHEGDGGRYVGTGCVVISRGPESDWTNLGCYRVMSVDERHVALYISPGKDGRLHRQAWFDRGEPFPVAVSLGHDPLLFLLAGVDMPRGRSEYGYYGYITGAPAEVVIGEVTGLPLPAHAEVVLEGYAFPDRMVPEGPFGEWTGYYASGARQEHLVEVKRVYYRARPYVLGSLPSKPPNEHSYFRGILRSGIIKEQLERNGVPGITGVWCHEAGGSRLFTAVSIRQQYGGHAKQVAALAAMCMGGAYLGRYVVVVDDDVDVTNLEDVIWAICTRSDPERSIDILRRTWSGPLDPAIPKAEKGLNSRALIDACRPWEWKDEFPPTCYSPPEVLDQVRKKWARFLSEA